jgi:ATP-dependent protease HslVU (ClpYQ) peptidase subunit
MQITADLIAQLGMGAIFLYLFLRKDEDLKNNNQKVLDAFTSSTASNVKLNETLEANTKAIEQNTLLTQKVWEVLAVKEK